MSNTTPPPHASSSYAYNYGGRWQGISVEKVINAFLQYLEMDPEKNEVNYDTYGRFHACYESVADAVYGEKQDANARRNDTKWLDTLWKQNRRKIRTIVLRKALEQSRISREQLEKCRRKALERAAANYDFIDTLPDVPVDSKNRTRATRHREPRNAASSASTQKQNGAARNFLLENNHFGGAASSQEAHHGGSGSAKPTTSQTQQQSNSTAPNFCVPVPVERCVKLAIFTSNSLKLGQLLAPFEMPSGTLLVLDNDEVFVFQKAHVNLNLQMALTNGQQQSAATSSMQSPPGRASSSPNAAASASASASAFESPPATGRTRNKRKSNSPRSTTRSKRFYEPVDDSGVAFDASAMSTDVNETVGECNEPDTRSSSNYSNVTGSPIVSNEDEPLTAKHARLTKRSLAARTAEASSSNRWFDEADVKPLIIAE